MTPAASNGLLQDFQCLHKEAPEWAWPFAPSMPLVGEKYSPGDGLLIYASAENFTWMHASEIPERFTTDRAWNRYRAAYEDEGLHSDSFFPCVGIQPATDGGLLAAGWYVAQRLGLAVHDSPRGFVETIALSNWCKFTIKEKTNKDYISDSKKTGESLPFVIAELAALRPRVVLVPNGVWKHKVLSTAMRGASPRTCFLPVAQFNTMVVNTHMCKHDERAGVLREQMATTPLAVWMKHLSGFNKRNAWRYIAFLEDTLEAIAPTG